MYLDDNRVKVLSDYIDWCERNIPFLPIGSGKELPVEFCDETGSDFDKLRAALNCVRGVAAAEKDLAK
jgi:hypothetical protein